MVIARYMSISSGEQKHLNSTRGSRRKIFDYQPKPEEPLYAASTTTHFYSTFPSVFQSSFLQSPNLADWHLIVHFTMYPLHHSEGLFLMCSTSIIHIFIGLPCLLFCEILLLIIFVFVCHEEQFANGRCTCCQL